jgi:hypothetical protein
MGFIRTLLIIILMYYLWKILFRYIVIPLFQKNSKVAGNQKSGHYRATKKEGETTIDFIPDKKKIISKDNGEYIDYEEYKK